MDEELYHYGVKGMKWGVRRTPAQLGHTTGTKKKRSGSAGEAVKNTAKKAAKAISNKVSETRRKRAEAKAHDAETKKIQENKKKKLSDLTDDELRQRIQRLELEKRYRDLTPKETSRGKAFIDAVGKQVLGPAVSNAARQKLEAVLKEQLGLNQKSVDALKGLRDEVEKLNLESKKATYQNNIDKQNAEREDRKKERKKAAEEKERNDAADNYETPSSRTESARRWTEDVADVDYSVVDITNNPAMNRTAISGQNYIAGLLEAPREDRFR